MDVKSYPSSLKNTSKRIERARKLVENRFNVKTIKGELAGFQGMWSETFIITLEDALSNGDRKAVIQFRAEPLDIDPFKRARNLLGSYCPEVEILNDTELEDAKFYPVYMSYISGHSWCTDPKQNKDPSFNVKVMDSLGKLLACCTIDNENDTSIVQDDLIGKLDKRLQSKKREVDPFRDIIQDLKERASELKKLPLFQSHMDLNDMNVMVTDGGEVTGIIDWELSPLYQPFGMGLHRIHDLAGTFEQQVYHQRGEYYDMEKAFWQGILSKLSARHRKSVVENLQAVQLAITIGTILWAFDFDTGIEFINPAVLAALPKFLSYRIPALRGDEPAYNDSFSYTESSKKRKTKK